MPTPRRRPRDVGWGVAALDLLVTALVLALVVGCGVDDGAVEEVAALPGVARASASCEISGCTLYVSLSDDVDADRLTAVLEAARTVGADRITVHEDEDPAEEPPRVAVDLDEEATRRRTGASPSSSCRASSCPACGPGVSSGTGMAAPG